jgi:thiopeptide-type bacteriocin biosynthesis protein
MPAHRLIQTGRLPTHPLERTEQAVLKVLAGVPLADAADGSRMAPADLDAAVSLFRQAGRQALAHQIHAADWLQLYIEYDDWASADTTAVSNLCPILDRAQAQGHITAWWFIRKYPCWRVRLRIQQPTTDVANTVAKPLNELVASGRLARWWTGIYEAETAAFGGPQGMATAHELFEADSHAVLTRPAQPTGELGPRELSVLLCTVLMRGAGLEWYELGDVWNRVTKERPLPADVTPDRLLPTAADLRHLLLADTTPSGPLFTTGGPAEPAAQWAAAFHKAGKELGAASRTGTLTRGLRDILAYHVIFHWNRLGLSVRMQSALAWSAQTAILNPMAHQAAQAHCRWNDITAAATT